MNYLIPIPNGQCLSTKRLKEVKKFIPENNVLRLHLVNEKLSLNQNKKYQPQPYIVQITQKEMDEIKKEINKKAKYNLNEVYILVQSRNLPIVKIEVGNE
jgi:hypothetical protein